MFKNVKLLLKFLFIEGIALLIFIPALIYFRFFFENKKSLIILNYHNFSAYNNFRIKRGRYLKTGYVKNFDKQISFIKKHFNFCYPDEFFNDNCRSGISFLLTFDDGYKDNFDFALPILIRYRAKSIFFVVTDYVGTKNWIWHDKVWHLSSIKKIDSAFADKTLIRMNNGVEVPQSFKDYIEKLFKNQNLPRLIMNWDEIKEIEGAGFKIGGHTERHSILTFIEDDEQRIEIEGSLNRINKEFKFKTNYFAYPNGLYNEKTIDILKDNNIQFAFTTIQGKNRLFQDQFQLKRLGINASDSIPLLLLKCLLRS